mmetsp:Transcript_35203/g.78341  ORF Transcript_35203/g.78341 Transcript_35203/m.78341 type:complete len:238 (-) Transcript_35203:46-759(-)
MKKRTSSCQSLGESGSSGACMAGTCKQGYPFSIVWSPIPLITWLMPCIGHMGVCNSEGVIYDFAGPFSVNEDQFLFGRPTRYLILEPRSAMQLFAGTTHAAEPSPSSSSSSAGAPSLSRSPSVTSVALWEVDLPTLASAWDLALGSIVGLYRCLWYNILTRNCHAFVADFMNMIGYQGASNWNMVHLAVLLFCKGRYASWGALLYTWLPFCLLMALGVRTYASASLQCPYRSLNASS